MQNNLAASFLYLGTIVLAFGLVISVIELLGARYGVHHANGVMLAVGLVVGGALLLGASSFMRRSGGATRSNS